jgi:outer membrane protein TolC
MALPSLAELEAAARNHGFDNREARAVAAQREAEARQAWVALLPALSAQADYLRNQYISVAIIPPFLPGMPAQTATFIPRNQWDLTATATLPLLDLSRWAAIVSTRRNREAEQAEVLATEINVAKSVATTYYQLLGAEAVVVAAERTRKAAEDNAAYLAARREAGFASELDLLRARAEVERDKQAIADAEFTLATMSRSLETLTGMAIKASFGDTIPPADLRDEAPLDVWLSGAENTPAVITADKRARAEEVAASQQRAGLLPSVSAVAIERFTNAVGFGTSPYYSVGFTASWKIDLATYTGAQAADAASDASAVRAARAAATARDDIHNAWQQVKAQIAKCKAARAQRAASKQAAAIASEKYAAGTAILLDLILAVRDDFTAEVTSLQADADLGAARASLRLSSGRSLFAGGP